MGSKGIPSVPDVPGVSASKGINKRIAQTSKAERNSRVMLAAANQIASEDNFEQWVERGTLFHPKQLHKNFRDLEKNLSPELPIDEPRPSEKTKESDHRPPTSEKVVEQAAKGFHSHHPELKPQALLVLYQRIHPNDDYETLLNKIRQFYSDETLIDEAIDFLIEVSEEDETLNRKLTETKEKFNVDFGRQIRAGRNIAVRVREFSKIGLGSPDALRELYREVTSEMRSSYDLFEDLLEQFTLSDMRNVLSFFLHSLGADMKAKGPSIPRSQLQQFLSETRSMQAILGVFRFFFGRMSLIRRQFRQLELEIPEVMTFEMLSRILMQMIQEKYPSTSSLLCFVEPLEISEMVAAQIVIFTQYRDAIRGVAPRLFASEKKRQELLMMLIETIKELEEGWGKEGEEDEDETEMFDDMTE